jgi:hypothetical protein
MVASNRNKSNSTLLSDIPLLVTEKYKSYRDSLEKNYSETSEGAVVEEKTKDLAIVADKAKEFARNREFYQLYSAIVDSVSKIESLNSSAHPNNYRLPDRIAKSLIDSIEVHARSLNILLASSEHLRDIGNYDGSSKKELKQWAEALENLGDAFEDNITFFSIDSLESIRNSLFRVIAISQQKESDSQTRRNTKNSYRIRIRNAAGFMCRAIDFEIEEAEAEDREILASLASANHPVFFE